MLKKLLIPATIFGLVSSAVGTAQAAVDSSPVIANAAHAVVRGVALTPAQVDSLRRAWRVDPNLSAAQARTAVGAADVVPFSSGEGTSNGECSEFTLWGDSDGNWRWDNTFYRRSAGPAEFGHGTVSTDDPQSLPGPDGQFNISGYEQHKSGQMLWTGFFPHGTRVDAWSVNVNASGETLLCVGDLFVDWD